MDEDTRGPWNPGPGKHRPKRAWVGIISHTGTLVQKAVSLGTGPGESDPRRNGYKTFSLWSPRCSNFLRSEVRVI